MNQFTAIIIVLFAVVFSALGAILLKKSSKNFKISLSILKNKHLMIGIILYGFSTILFIPALKHGQLSVIYPFVATVYIWVTLFSKRFLKEEINFYKWLGILLIIVGVIFIGIGA